MDKFWPLFFALFDGSFNAVLIFGWVTLTEIYKREGYFACIGTGL